MRPIYISGSVELKDYQAKLIEAAERAMANSYCPYSRYSVGAALLADDGEIVTGVNVENATYTLTVHAEMSAICSAIAKGKRRYVAIAVITKPPSGKEAEPAFPCGICRQAISEAAQMSGKDMEVIASNTDKSNVQTKMISELLPLGFGPKNLKG